MKARLIATLGLLTVFNAQAQTSSAVQAVEAQVKGYNARDVEAFLAPYSDSVALYTFPDKLLSKSKAAMRQRYTSLFSKMPKLHCEVTSRLIEGNTIIDQERITGVGDKVLTAVAIYQVEGGKISRVYFVH